MTHNQTHSRATCAFSTCWRPSTILNATGACQPPSPCCQSFRNPVNYIPNTHKPPTKSHDRLLHSGPVRSQNHQSVGIFSTPVSFLQIQIRFGQKLMVSAGLVVTVRDLDQLVNDALKHVKDPVIVSVSVCRESCVGAHEADMLFVSPRRWSSCGPLLILALQLYDWAFAVVLASKHSSFKGSTARPYVLYGHGGALSQRADYPCYRRTWE
jgi:hypothetical protein